MPNRVSAANASGRYGREARTGQLERREPQPYVQAEPLLVAEFVVDQAYDRGRCRRPVRHLSCANLGPAP
jgi:hypothetical protein